MSKIYDIDFLTKEDLLTLFNSAELSHKPDEKELVGKWEGMLVSDSSLLPRSQIFYFDYEDGEIDMRYSFANMLHGRSDITITDNSIFRLDDQTPFHDEIRMVTPDFAIGLWISEWSSKNILEPIIQDLIRYYPIKILTNDDLNDKLSFLKHFYLPGIQLPKELGLSFLQIEENEQNETRVGLSYILKRI